MKIFCIVFVTFGVILAVTSAGIEDVKKKLMDDTESCRKDLMPDDKMKMPSKKDLECLAACYLEKTGLMNDSKKLVTDNFEKLFDGTMKTKDGKKYTELSKTIGEKCKSVTHENKCAAAEMIIDCLFGESVRLNGLNVHVQDELFSS